MSEREYQERNREEAREKACRIRTLLAEDDETFFRKMTQGLSSLEMEEYLEEFPEYRKYLK